MNANVALKLTTFATRTLPSFPKMMFANGALIIRLARFAVGGWSVFHVNDLLRSWFALLVGVFLLADFFLADDIPPYEIDFPRKAALALARRMITLITSVGLADGIRSNIVKGYSFVPPVWLTIAILFLAIWLLEIGLEVLLVRPCFRRFNKSRIPLRGQDTEISPPDGPYTLIVYSNEPSTRIQILDVTTRAVIHDLGNVVGKFQKTINHAPGAMVVVNGTSEGFIRSNAKLEIWKRTHHD